MVENIGRLMYNAKRKANAILARYNKWLCPGELQNMYRELESIGISFGLITNRCDHTYPTMTAYGWDGSCEVYYTDDDGEVHEYKNCHFTMMVYTDLNHSKSKNEYTMYIS